MFGPGVEPAVCFELGQNVGCRSMFLCYTIGATQEKRAHDCVVNFNLVSLLCAPFL